MEFPSAILLLTNPIHDHDSDLICIAFLIFFLSSIFLDLVKKSGLKENLTKDEQFTVFAPSDDAFKDLSDRTKKFFFESKEGIQMVRRKYKQKYCILNVSLCKNDAVCR